MQYHGKTKRKRVITLVISYVLMTLAVVALSIICILLVLGYRFDPGTQSVERGALLRFESFPSAATVSLNGKNLSARTPTKQDVEVGEHQVVISREGYRPWIKDFSLRAGEVRYLNYARLIPTIVSTTEKASYPTLADALPSKNREWLVLLQKNDTPTLDVVDVRNGDNLRFSELTIPDEVLTLPEGSVHTFSLKEWDLDSNHLLVRHNFGANLHEYIRINRNNPRDIINVSTKFGMTFSELHFSSGDIFYGVENGNLRRFDLSNGSISEPIARNVEQMKLYEARDLVVVQRLDTRLQVAVVVDNKLTQVASYDVTMPLLVDLTRYFNERYVAIARGSSFELIKNPEKRADQGLQKIITLTYAAEAKWLDLSSNGRFAMMGSGTNYMTYDIELARRTDTRLPGGPVDTAKPLQWLDDFIVVSTADNKLRFSDFDGANQQIITDSMPNAPVVLSPNGEVLYNFVQSPSGTVTLNAVKMIVD